MLTAAKKRILLRKNFSPLQYFGSDPTGILANWDANFGVTLNSGNVSSWVDKIGRNDAVQATANLQPAYSATGWDGSRPCLTGDGAATDGDVLVSSTGPFGAAQSVFIVAERGTQTDDAGANTRAMFSTGLSSGGAIALCGVRRPTTDAGQTEFVGFGAGAGNANTVATAFASGAKAVLFSQTQDNALLTRVNGGSAGAAGDVGASVTSLAQIFGITTTAASKFAGKIAEILVVGRIMASDAERQLVEGYLAWKWGIQANLAAGHPYLFVRP